MRIRSWILLLVVGVIIGLTGAAVWTLRTPLQEVANLVWSRTRAPAGVTFAVVGDNHGDNPVYRQILKELPDHHPAFLLNLADTSEYGTTDEFEAVKRLEQPLPFPVYHTVGNHDIKTDPTGQLLTATFGHSLWYAVDEGNVHLVILDNADRKVGFPNESLDWLEHDLSAHQTQTILIAYHRPFDLPLATLLGDDETTTSRRSNERLVDIIERYHARYVFTGHVHTYLQYSVGSIPAVVSGGGGDPAQSILGGPSHNYFHYLIVTVRGTDVSIIVHRVTLPI